MPGEKVVAEWQIPIESKVPPLEARSEERRFKKASPESIDLIKPSTSSSCQGSEENFTAYVLDGRSILLL